MTRRQLKEWALAIGLVLILAVMCFLSEGLR